VSYEKILTYKRNSLVFLTYKIRDWFHNNIIIIIRFGKTVITLTATCEGSSALKDQNATILLFFIKIKA
jgi:hypothetical protein